MPSEFLRDNLQAALTATYTIERELGGGGMSRVFLADEVRLGRRVVLKVLPPDLGGAMSAERFEREIQLAARLQHPHIVPLLAAGKANGLLYYTMPFVEGETLRERMSREGRIPAVDALRMAAEMAGALACAHAGGVVHRDIKPENVLLSSGHAMVADFGIAKAISLSRPGSAGPDGGEGLTALGTSLGTPAYMSPEQAAGESDLDGRSDIYSLGCVLYEMLAGRAPFTGPSAAAVISKRFFEVPPALCSIDGAIHAEVDALVARMMAREPADRFATAHDLLTALAAIPGRGSAPRPAVEAMPSIAVLPFANMGGAADDEYFSDGMTEEVINTLGRLPGLRVAARTSAFAFKGQHVDLATIARQLRVQHVLEGSVRRAGDRVRISVQLVNATDGLHLWSERYDREMADVFALQDEIGHAISAALEERLGASGRARRDAGQADALSRGARAAVDPEAYDVYLRGRFLFERHQALEAIACFERAAERDPGFALAHAWVGVANMLSANLYMMPALVAYPRARAATTLAMALEPGLVEARLARAIIALWFDWDIVKADTLTREVLALAPGDTQAHEFRGWTLLIRGDVAGGAAALEHAYELDPLSDFMLYNTGLALTLAGRAPRAHELLRAGAARAPASASLHLMLGFALAAAGRFDDARDALERSRQLAPSNPLLMGTLVSVLAATGDAAGARRLLAQGVAQSRAGAGVAVEVACAHQAVGETEDAFEWLERAFAARDLWLSWLHLDPRFVRLHGDPRFSALVQRVGMAGPPAGVVLHAT